MADLNYGRVFDCLPGYAAVLDRDLKIIAANERFRTDLGAFGDRPCHDVFRQNPTACPDCPVAETFRDGRGRTVDGAITTCDGRRVPVVIHTSPIRDAAGDVVGVAEVATDIGPLDHARSEVESMSALISTASHGIKGLLTGLDGGIYFVDSGLAKDNQSRLEKGWAMVRRNVERIRSMVVNNLYYSKERIPAWERVSAADLLDNSVALIKARAREFGVDLTAEPGPGAGKLDADPQAMTAVFVNLLENALDSCQIDRSGDAHHVSITVSGTAREVTFEITEDGAGLETETREKGFDRYYTAATAREPGLRLFIANKIVRAHQGTIELDESASKGSRLVVRLPRRRR